MTKPWNENKKLIKEREVVNRKHKKTKSRVNKITISW